MSAFEEYQDNRYDTKTKLKIAALIIAAISILIIMYKVYNKFLTTRNQIGI